MTYLSRKLVGCTYPGCLLPPLEDHCQCRKHRDWHRLRNKKHMRIRRAVKRVQLGLGL